MQALLLAIQSALRSGLSDIRSGDIFITPHVNFVPPGVKAPAIGIKDGPGRVSELGGSMQETTLQVKLVIWVDFPAGEEMIIGKGTMKGVLDRTTEVHAVLGQNLLSIDGMISARPVAETESEMFSDGKGRGLDRKIITYEYEKEETLWGTS
ncbi:MAG: hypothetical protein ABIK68_05250 [bacterium]